MNFDPYREWLEIPSARRPPTPHDLLGVPLEECDADRLRAAYARRYAHVRKYAVGPHSKAALKLLDELSLAFTNLCTGGPGFGAAAAIAEAEPATPTEADEPAESLNGNPIQSPPGGNADDPSTPRPRIGLRQLFLLGHEGQREEPPEERRLHDGLAFALLVLAAPYFFLVLQWLWTEMLSALIAERNVDRVATGLLQSFGYFLGLIAVPALFTVRLLQRACRPGFRRSVISALAPLLAWTARTVWAVIKAPFQWLAAVSLAALAWLGARLASAARRVLRRVRPRAWLSWPVAWTVWLVRGEATPRKSFARGTLAGITAAACASTLLFVPGLVGQRPRAEKQRMGVAILGHAPLAFRAFVLPEAIADVHVTPPAETIVRHAVSLDAEQIDLVRSIDDRSLESGRSHMFAVPKSGHAFWNVQWAGRSATSPAIYLWDVAQRRFMSLPMSPEVLPGGQRHWQFDLAVEPGEPFAFVLVGDLRGGPVRTDYFSCEPPE
jgi:hypothetical protein